MLALNTKGEKLDKKDFALYCLLLEKVWKKHLLSCYCPDGVINPTSGNSPLSSDGSALQASASTADAIEASPGQIHQTHRKN